MCDLSTKEQRALKSISIATPDDDGKILKWDAALKKFVFADSTPAGNYVTTDTDQELFGHKIIWGWWDFQNDNVPTIQGQEIATTDYVQAWAANFVNLGNYAQTIDGDKQFVRRPKTSIGLGGYENLVAASDLAAYVTSSGLTTTLSSYALKSGNLSQFAATTSAQLAALISDETGTGALVFANTPSIATPILTGGTFQVNGATSGRIFFNVPAAAGSNTLSFQAVTDTLAVLGTAQTWTATQTFAAISGTTITGTTIQATTQFVSDGYTCNAAQGGVLLRFKSGGNGSGVYIDNAVNGNIVGNPPSSATFNLFDMTATTFNPAAGSKKFRGINLSYTLTPSGTQTSNDFTAIFVNGTEGGSLQGMTHLLMDLQLGGVSSIRATNAGGIAFGSTMYNYIACALGSNGSQSITGTALRVAHNLGSTAGYGIHVLGVNGTMSWTSGTGGTLFLRDSFGAATGTGSFTPLNITYTINNSGAQTGSSTATGIYVLGIETALNGMVHNLIDLQSTISGTTTSKFKVVSNAAVSVFDGNGLSVANTIKATDFNFTSGGIAIRAITSGIGLGGITSSFPAIKRNGTAIDFKLADDSAFASINLNVMNASTAVATNMYLTNLKDVGGVNNVAVISSTSITMASTAILITAASTTTQAGFRLLSGTAPATPTNGDVWIEGTGDTSIKIRHNGVTRSFQLI